MKKFYKTHNQNSSKGFTLIELLTVVAIIGILSAILIPTVGGARKAALDAKSRAQFNDIAKAMVLYKNEYGYWPTMSQNPSKPVHIYSLETNKYFIPNMTGQATDYNRKGIGFYSATLEEEFIEDAWGNTDIKVLIHTNGATRNNPKITKEKINKTSARTGAPVELNEDGSDKRKSVSPKIQNDVYAPIVIFSAGNGEDPIGTWTE